MELILLSFLSWIDFIFLGSRELWGKHLWGGEGKFHFLLETTHDFLGKNFIWMREGLSPAAFAGFIERHDHQVLEDRQRTVSSSSRSGAWPDSPWSSIASPLHWFPHRTSFGISMVHNQHHVYTDISSKRCFTWWLLPEEDLCTQYICFGHLCRLRIRWSSAAGLG